MYSPMLEAVMMMILDMPNMRAESAHINPLKMRLMVSMMIICRDDIL